MDSHIRRYKRIVKKINQLEAVCAKLDEQEFRSQTELFRLRLKAGEKMSAIMPMAYALVREAAKRTAGLWAFDTQLMGALAANEGKIVEMKTGEGKTLTIVFPAYLNALAGQGVHVITANDYLAERDAAWAGRIFQMLGMSVGFITSKTSDFDRQVSYTADVTYLTNNEAGFDYLKDNMLYDERYRRQRGLYYAIIDEADSVLIDEAQTPLVISDNQGPNDKDREMFSKLNPVVKQLEKGVDFKIDLKFHTVSLTIPGIKKLEQAVQVENLYGDNEEDFLYYIERLLKAYYLFQKDRDYIIEDGRIVIVDEFTGRLMQNHRFYQGLHQAIEAKEGVQIYSETETLASITFQNFFKRYQNFSGFTGTAFTSEKEFKMIYRKDVVVIPTHKPVVRTDLRDRFFLRWEDKLNYLAWATQEHFYKKRAVLIGTRSVAKSQQVQEVLISQNIPSNVLNAKHTRREAEVIAHAGTSQTVTVATNMAGRGTDIELDDNVRAEGGLVIYGTERHNAKRIDNQLLGRSGRQGDPGLTQFLISADDALIKLYFKDKYEKEIRRRKDYRQGVESVRLEQLLRKAQQRVEDLFFDQRVLGYEFDKVLDLQRESFYAQRLRVLQDDVLRSETLTLIKHEIYQLILRKKTRDRKIVMSSEMIEIGREISAWVNNGWLKYQIDFRKHYSFSRALQLFYQSVANYYDDFESYVSPAKLREIEKITSLKVLDLLWVEHLKKVEMMQDAAMISSISRNDFFEQYKIQMAKTYQQMLLSIPRVLCQTLFRTMNRLWHAQPATPQT